MTVHCLAGIQWMTDLFDLLTISYSMPTRDIYQVCKCSEPDVWQRRVLILSLTKTFTNWAYPMRNVLIESDRRTLKNRHNSYRSSMNCLINSSHASSHLTMWICTYHCFVQSDSNSLEFRYPIKLIWWAYLSCTCNPKMLSTYILTTVDFIWMAQERKSLIEWPWNEGFQASLWRNLGLWSTLTDSKRWTSSLRDEPH